MSGCLVSSNSHDENKGKRIPQKTLKKFEPGVTTKEWTLAVLGSPSNRDSFSDGKEIFRYDYSHKVHTDTTIFFLFDGSTHKTQKQTTYFEFEGERLKRYWIEDD